MASLLEVRDLRKTFRTGLKSKVEALRGVGFSVDGGGIVGLIGPNGAGKSTTIKIVFDFFRPDHGSVALRGHPAGSMEARRLIGYMPEHPAFPDTLTGREIMRYAAGLSGYRPADLEKRIVTMLERVEVAHALDRPVRGYSKGMLQRLGLAQAFLTEPELVILDEPMSGLDPLGRTCFKAVMREQAAAGMTIFFSSHILADIEGICERMIMIHRGRVEADGPVRDVLRGSATRLRGLVTFRDNAQKPDGWLAGVLRPVTGWRGYEFEIPGGDSVKFLQSLSTAGGELEKMERAQESLEDYFVRIVRADESGNANG